MARSRCAKTGKTRYPDKLEADLAMADTLRSNSHHRHRKYRDEPTRSYECGACHGWHLTSMTEEEYENQNRSTA